MAEKECIERQIVLDALNDIGGCGSEPKSYFKGWDDAIGEAVKIVEQVPAVNSPSKNLGKDMRGQKPESKAIKLAPCRYCGEERFISVNSKVKMMKHYKEATYTYQVRCNNCFARGSVKKTKQEAIDAWNGSADNAKDM